jgi:hypothetical protein
MTPPVGWPQPNEPLAKGSSRSRARSGLGALGLLLVILAVAAGALFRLISMVTYARGDWVDRVTIGFGLLIALAAALTLIGFSNWSTRSIVRSPVAWLFAALCLLALGWAAFGIDSTRDVNALPEASLSYPGAIETGRHSAPASGLLDGAARATVTRKFSTTDPSSAIKAFYATELAERGWEGPIDWGSTGDVRWSDWRRDGFMFQLTFVDSDPAEPGSTGPYSVRIYGPEK